MDELRNVMHERRNYGGFLISFEIGLDALILPKRMQFTNEEAPSRDQSTKGFRKNERQIANVFEHKVAHDSRLGPYAHTGGQKAVMDIIGAERTWIAPKTGAKDPLLAIGEVRKSALNVMQ